MKNYFFLSALGNLSKLGSGVSDPVCGLRDVMLIYYFNYEYKVKYSKEAKQSKVSIKIEKNEKLSNDQVQGSDQQQQKKEPSRQSSTNEKSPQMTRITTTILLQAIQATSHLLQVKTQNNR